jgi:CheY-like chemotaxis protein
MPIRSTIRGHILLADDDFELRVALAAVLQRWGYHVETVSSGIALLDRLSGALLEGASVPADAIVTDVRMPGCNGLSIVEGLRGNGWTVPLVVISAFADDDMRARVARLDNVGLLEKPFDPEALDLLLRDALTH